MVPSIDRTGSAWAWASRALAVFLAGALVTGAASSGPRDAGAAGAMGCVDTTEAIAWWPGDDTTTALVGPDAAGSPAYADAVVGRGFALDGMSRVEATGVDVVVDEVTVEAWVRPDQTGRTQAIISRWDFPSGDDGARAYSLLLDPFGTLIWSIDEVSARRPVDLRASAPQLFDGQFHHVAATRDASEMVVYVDGAVVSTAPSTAGSMNPATTVDTGVGGQATAGLPFLLSGVLDEPTIWSRAIRADEVATIHANGPFGKCFVDPVQQAKLVPADGKFLDRFGTWVDIDGDTAAVGAFGADALGSDSGAVYVYRYDGTSWAQEQKLTASDGTGGDFFGISVALDGDTLIVGANLEDAAGADSGSAYVFTRSGTTWTEEAKLVAPDGAQQDRFGYAVDLSGDTVVVGALDDDDNGPGSGAAYVFTRLGTAWSFEQKLLALDGQASDHLGEAVAVDGDTVVVGAKGDDDSGTNAGSGYVFSRDGTTWTQEAKLLAPDGAQDDEFGFAVGVSADRVVIGAHLDDDSGADSGSVHVYRRAAGPVWGHETKLLASDGGAGDHFGSSLDLDGPILAIGARYDDDLGGDSGSTYVFGRTGTIWGEQAKLLAADGTSPDLFGWSVALGGASLIVGAYTDEAGLNSGSAYVFGL